MKLNFDDKLFVTAYNILFSGTGKLHGNSGSTIKGEDYSEGYTIIVADLTPFEIGDNFDLKAEYLRIDLVFKSPLAATVNVLVYAEYDNVIEIDSNHNVIKDYAGINFIHNHPPRAHPEIFTKQLPPPWGFSLEKGLISIICKYPGKIMEFSKFHLNSK